LKLIILISGGTAYLLGLGWLLIGPISHGSLTRGSHLIPFFDELPSILTSGIIVNHAIVSCLQQLPTSLVTGTTLSIIGIFCFGVYIYRARTQHKLYLKLGSKLLGIIVLCLLFLGPIFMEPLNAWDARSIWFFHAKMIYTAGTLGQSAGWQDPAVYFSHPDYPNLIPVLSAQVAYVAGYWNEYIPKASLFFLLIPTILWLFTFARKTFSFVILSLLLSFSFSRLLWNGYMDGYLALYFSISMLLLGRYIQTMQASDLIASLCCLAILLYIKNEGLLAVLAGCFSAIMTGWFLRKNSFISRIGISFKWKYLFAVLLALLPVLTWNLHKQQWGLSNDLAIGTDQSFLRITNRLTDGSYKLILQSIYHQIEASMLLLGVVYFANFIQNKGLPKESLPALLAAGSYCLGIMVIYLLTPVDVVWHLGSSVDRTMLSVIGCIIVGSYYLLRKIEINHQISYSSLASPHEAQTDEV